MTKHEVLIVGAGPTGLMMACELARRGIHFRIIDKKPEPTQGSNATWVQTRTLELLDQMGIVERFLKMGHRCDAINLYANGKHLAKLSLKEIDAIYSFILMLPQSKTEKLLEAYLNELHHQVERATELVDVTVEKQSATTTLKHADGSTETITADWLIACDGANSVVREKSGFLFQGEDLPEQFMVADATIDFSFMPKNEIQLFFDPETVLAAFPLGKDKYRIAANLNLGYSRQHYTEREVIEIVQERAHGEYYVTNVEWISPFWIHGKLADGMRNGPIFLAGDAAHIHSPAGGQGMNTGMQDAMNLAWKLALVIQGKAKPELLDSYQLERYPVVKEVVKQNDHFTKMALFEKGFLTQLKKFAKELARDQKNELATKIGKSLAQLDIKYQHSPFIDYNTKLNKQSPHPGEVAPNVTLNKSTLYQYFRNNAHQVLLFAGEKPDKSTLNKLLELRKWVEEKDASLLKAHLVVREPGLTGENVIIDSEGMIHACYHAEKPQIYLIRPDNYIAYASENLDIKALEKCLKPYIF